jgi:hypothetical protein
VSIHRRLSVAELAAIVSEALNSAGIQAVLSGGSVVTIYAGNEWESRDLDFVVARVDRKRIEGILAGLGFRRQSVRLFSHPKHTHWVDLCPWPIMLGEEFVDRWNTLETSRGTLQLLSPTQCVKDRLTGFYHANDRQSLDQAVAVFIRHDVKLREIERWSARERSIDKFRELREAIRRARPGRR